MDDLRRFLESIHEMNNLYGNVLEVEQVDPSAWNQEGDALVHMLLKGDQQHIQELLNHDRKKYLIQYNPLALNRCPSCKRIFLIAAPPPHDGLEDPKPIFCPYDKIEVAKKSPGHLNGLALNTNTKGIILTSRYLIWMMNKGRRG
ncbi:hypothetical protein D770_11525 [Flammeovirgaceae bacterium 311]|nr:hypothetical protein D770_11525 [Flammeovirgaceae bacterium 311]